MQHRHGFSAALLFCGVLIAGLLVEIQTASAYECVHTIMGVCTIEGGSCEPPEYGHCYTVKIRDYPYKQCSCLKDRPERPHEGSLHIGIGGIHIGIGGSHGIGFDVSTGGYCDRWGCPDDYWGYPVFYGPVYFDGEWYDGPAYYRETHDGYEYWVHGGWHRDEWRGTRPDWANDTHYGPALGRDYYQSDEFRHGHENDHARTDHTGGSSRSSEDECVAWEKNCRQVARQCIEMHGNWHAGICPGDCGTCTQRSQSFDKTDRKDHADHDRGPRHPK